MFSEQELAGTWRLVSIFHLDKDGATQEGPLGPHADGILIYDRRGYMSVGLMRVGEPPDTPAPPTTYMGYSGRWQLADQHVIHQVAVSSHSRIVNTTQVRELQAEGDRLVLRERIDDTPRYLVLTWQRA
jgi:hypothetical protein